MSSATLSPVNTPPLEFDLLAVFDRADRLHHFVVETFVGPFLSGVSLGARRLTAAGVATKVSWIRKFDLEMLGRIFVEKNGLKVQIN